MIKTIKYTLIVLLTFLVVKSTVYGQYNGGDGDGAGINAQVTETCVLPPQFYAYLGGNTDGFSTDYVSFTVCGTPPQFYAYSGGNANGASTDTVSYLTCGTPAQSIAYMGGNADGFSLDTASYTSCADPPQYYAYYGGNSDGFSNDSVINLNCPFPAQFYAYTGGTGDGFDIDTANICPTTPPEADFTASATNICAGSSVTFTDISTNYPSDWEWTFDGGTPSSDTVQNPVVYYNAPGTYTVQLIAVNFIGMDTVTKTGHIIVNALPTIDFGADVSICSGETALLVAPAGFNSYLWNDATTDDSLSTGVAGAYSVTVTDANNCTATDGVNVIVNVLPVVDLGSDVSVCTGTPVTLDAGGGYTNYDWSNGGSTNRFLNVITGDTYEVTVTDVNGCNGTDAVDVVFLALPVVDLGPDSVACIGATVTLDAGIGFTTYAWSSGGSITNTLDVTATGTYIVNVTDGNGCVGTNDIDVSFITTVFPSLGADASACSGDIVTLDAGSFTTYLWSPGGGSSQTLNVSASGTYYLTVTDADGCMGTDDIDVTIHNLPLVNFGSDISACNGDVVLLDAGAGFADYYWSDGLTTTQTFPVTGDGTFSVTVTDAYGCTGLDNVDVTFNALPVVDLGDDSVTCDGTTITLNAGNGYAHYAWSNDGSTNQWLNVTTNDTYSVTVTDGNGCIGSDDVLISFSLLPVVDLGVDVDACAGDSAILYAGNSFVNYAWSDGTTGIDTIVVNISDLYSVTVTDAYGCQGTDDIQVDFHSLPVVNFGADLDLCQGETGILYAGAGFGGYAWTGGASVVDSLVVTTGGLYGATVTDIYGCQGSDEINITFHSNPAVDLGSDLDLCQSETGILYAGTGFAVYEWTGAASYVDSLVVASSGNYGATVTDIYGCQGSDAIIVTVHSLPVVDLGTNLDLCTGETAILYAGTGYASYSWTDGITTIDSLEVDATGSYGVTVSDSFGCVGSDAINLTIHALPVVDFGSDADMCDGETAILYAGEGYADYNWTGGTSVVDSLIVTASGNFSATVTDIYGCQGSDDITITFHSLPVVDFGANLDLCTGQSTILYAGIGYSAYSWSDGTTTVDSLEVNATGTYSVTVYDSFGCEGSDVINVTFHTLPLVDLGGDLDLCNGETAILYAGTGFAGYDWSDGTTAIDSLVVNVTGTYGVTVTDSYGCIGSDAAIITFHALPVVDFGPNISLCDDIAILYAGAGYVSYTWSDGTTNIDSLIADTTGIYSVTVTDAYGCEGWDSISVGIHFHPEIELGTFPAMCTGDTVILHAGAGYANYDWSNGVTGVDSLIVTAGGYFMVTVTDIYGCVGGDDVTVNFNPLPVVNLGQSLNACAGDQVIIDAGTGFTDYEWSNGVTGIDSIIVTVTGTYSVTVTDGNGCLGNDAVVINFNALPVVNFGNDTSFCDGETAMINAGTGFADYTWSTGANDVNFINVTVSGTYSVTVVDNNGCHGGDEIIITFNSLPVVNLGNDTAFCTGQTAAIYAGTGFADYAWSTGATGIDSILVTATGTYDVTVTDANGCQGDDDVIITFNSLPVVSLGNDTSFCTGQTAVVYAGTGFAGYEWSTGATGIDSILVTTGGYINVTVTDANGCQGGDDVIITFHSLPVVSLGNDTSFCTGETAVVYAGTGFAGYAWSTGATGIDSILVTTSGAINVTVTDTNGCQGDDDVVITFHPLPVVNLADTLILHPPTPATLDAGNPGSSYMWSTGHTTQSISVSTSGLYSVTVTNSFGCYDRDTVIAIISGIAGIDGNTAGIAIFPNPAKTFFTVVISHKTNTDAKIELLSVNGKKLGERNTGKFTDIYDETFNVDNLPKGVYYIRVTDAGAVYTKKVVVQ